jgi:hypothetical protein
MFKINMLSKKTFNVISNIFKVKMFNEKLNGLI